MITKWIKYNLLLLLIAFTTNCFASENIFYALRFKSSDRMSSPEATMHSLKKHYKQIGILVPQAFYIDENGVVGGEIEPAILNFAVSKSMKIMPLVTNYRFDKQKAHQFLADPKVQRNALAALINLCKQNHFYGIQLDFEMIAKEDRDALTQFYQSAADIMHQHGFVISFALAPVVTEHPDSFFLTKIYNNWEAAYDFKKLGEAADFVSIMAYNQHAGITTPGSTANWQWVNQIVNHALKYISAKKISLALPAYSTYWYVGTTTNDLSGRVMVKMRGISYQDVMTLKKKYKIKFYWNHDEKYYFAIFSRDWLNEYLFVEDAKVFRYKFNLIKQYKLRGVSVFDLGTEAPAIWKSLLD